MKPCGSARPVFEEYASFYDLLYRDKDYAAEARFVDALLRLHHPDAGRSLRVLDLACGTGRHAFELEKLGYEMEGCEPSAPMAERARQSAVARGSRLVLHGHSFQTADAIGGKFDAVISMFSAVGYLLEYAELCRAFGNVRGLLAPGGLFLFDHWNGTAVLRDYSPMRTLRKREGEQEILRISETSLDPVRQWADVRFTCMRFVGDVKMTEFEEVHRVRFFFFREMEALLAASGFRILSFYPFLEPDRPARTDDWNVSVVATPI